MIITIARKPLDGTVVNTVLQHNCGALNIDASRIGTGTGEVKTLDHRSGNYGQDTQAYAERAKLTITRVDQGRWPANTILTEVVLSTMDSQSGTTTSSGGGGNKAPGSNGIYGAFKGRELPRQIGLGDPGTASRFFKQIKED